MKAGTHIAGGTVAWSLTVHAAAALGASMTGVFIAGGMAVAGFAAPWNDLDNLGAWSRRKRLGRTWPAKTIVIRAHPFKRWASWIVTRWGSHRKSPTHSLLGCAGFALCAAAPAAWWPGWPVWLPLPVLAGLWSHLALDLLTERPLRLFWPHSALVHGLPRPLRCKVGGKGELAWSAVIFAAVLWSVIYLPNPITR